MALTSEAEAKPLLALPLAGLGHWDPAGTDVGRWAPVVLVSVVALPVAALAVRALMRWRPGRPDARSRSVAEVAMVVGTLPWLWMTFTPLPAPPRRLRLVPLLDIANLVTGEPAFALVQVVGNLFVFAAFGFFAPRRWPVSTATVVALAAAGSVAIEVTQYLLGIGRVTSVDDVLLNTAGAGLAALVSRRLLDRPARLNDRSSRGLTSD
jgi:hypothetical protein